MLHGLPRPDRRRSGHAFLFELGSALRNSPSMPRGLPQLDLHQPNPLPNYCPSGAWPVPPCELGNTAHIHLGLPWLMHAILVELVNAPRIPASMLHGLPQLDRHQSSHAFLFELGSALRILPSMLHGLPQLDQHQSDPLPNYCPSGAGLVPPCELGNNAHIHLGWPWLMHAFPFELADAPQILAP